MLQRDESRVDIFVRFLRNFPRHVILSPRFMMEDASELDDDTGGLSIRQIISAPFSWRFQKKKGGRNDEGFTVTLLRHQKRKMGDETGRSKPRERGRVVKIFRTFTDTFWEYRDTNFGNQRRTRVNISRRVISYGCVRFRNLAARTTAES